MRNLAILKRWAMITVSTIIAVTVIASPAVADGFADPAMVTDINPSGNGNPGGFTALGNTLVFAADNGANGVELWKSDGTDAGTVMVKDICAGGLSSYPHHFIVLGSALFFAATNNSIGNYELWKSDGTNAGTVMLKDINPSGGSAPGYFTIMGSTLFFRASDGTNGYQYQLWKSDGTDAGTVMVKDICPYADCFTVMGSTLFFSADDGTNGYELWKSDGTEGGTAMVKDINVSGSSEPIALTVVGSTLFFVANDGTNGCELWRSDGTGAGTVMVKDINPLGSSLFSADMAPNALAVMGSTLFFKATDGTHGYELWKSDATDAGTVMVKDINPSGLSSPYCLTVVDGTLFFFASDGIHDFELWRTNGTDAGTTMIKDINPSGSSNPSLLTVVGSTLVFAATDGTRGYELWSSDGTDAGTVMVRDINPGSGSSSPRCFVPMGSTLFFSANDGTHGFELWKMEAMTKYSVGIDIKPGSDPNSINPKSKGLTPVAILTAPGFDASTADPSTVELTGSLGSAFAVKWQMLDVPQVWDPVLLKFVGDGDLDLVLYFSTQELATSVLAPTDVEATLTGETTGGVPIEGADPVHIVKK